MRALTREIARFEDKIPLHLPLRESHPRVPSPWGDEIFYYSQVDTIKEVQKGKSWKWCDVRPDGISGQLFLVFISLPADTIPGMRPN